MKRIAWTEQAWADVRSLDKGTALRILHALHRFAESGAGRVACGPWLVARGPSRAPYKPRATGI